jgi:hypothetical protein
MNETVNKHLQKSKELTKKGLQKVRQQPDFIKKQIAFWGALTLTAIIFFIWVFTFNFGRIADGFQQTGKNIQHLAQPFEAVKSDLSGIKDGWGELQSLYSGWGEME